MSKEIAQTVGTKRMAWLIAILAAFAVFATVGSQFRDAKALVVGANYEILSSCSGTVAVGTTCNYTINFGGNGSSTAVAANSAGPVTILAIMDSKIGNITSVDHQGFNAAENDICVVSSSGGTNNRLDCTYSPRMFAGSAGTITFSATALGRGVVNQSSQFGAIDTGCTGAGCNPAGTNSGGLPLTITGAGLALAKAQSSATPATGSNVTYILTLTNPVTAVIGASATNAHVLDTVSATAFASIQSVTAAGGTVNTCSGVGAMPDTTSPWAIDCNIGTLAEGATATVTIVATLNSVAQAAAGQAATCVTVTNTGTATADNSATATSNTTSLQNCGAAGAAIPDTTAIELWHLAPYGGAPEANRDRDNNLVGFLHKVCATNAIVDALWPTPLSNSQTVGLNWKIDTISGTSNINAPVIVTGTNCDGDTAGAGLTDDSTISWYSTTPGEQNITVVDDGGTIIIDSNTTTGTLTPATPLVKEWNTLLPTIITSTAPATAAAALAATNIDGATGTAVVSFNTANGTYYTSSAGVTVYENVLGSHTNAAGTFTYFVAGAKVTFLKTGTCGTLSISGGFITAAGPYAPSGSLTDISTTVPTIVYTNGTGPIAVTMSAPLATSNCTFVAGQTIGFTAQAAYPTDLGSQTPVVPLERYQVILIAQLQVKQVFLAWAGQRIILEHDWRTPAGDVSETVSNGVCPFGIGQQFQYIRGTGPGNFLQGLGAVVTGNDQAIVTLADLSTGLLNNQLGDRTVWPQGACISRVLYESEDPGEVDIELFAVSPAQGAGGQNVINSTKVAFVVYYMKLNTVAVSLVTQVSKPTHNSSIVADYSPGNPWDASKDAAENKADWNVSRDLLVRGRVTGWFTNTNPSGRAEDKSDPLNVLPANRWVMPNDWVLLAGGPADNADNSRATGTAESFRPEYDIMVNPGRGTRGLDTPTAGFFAQFSTLNAAVDATSLTIKVNYPGVSLAVGNILRIDNEEMLVVDVTNQLNPPLNTILTVTVQRGMYGSAAAAHAVGAIVLRLGTAGTVFEGPYSLIDIVTFLSNTGTIGAGTSAALSSFAPGQIRDTVWKDGDVDWWDAPMPPALVTVDIRGTGFIKRVIKSDVYYNGTANGTDQTYPNPFYISAIPDSPYIPANVAGGGYFWNSWGVGVASGAYPFWAPIPAFQVGVLGTNAFGVTDSSVTASQAAELVQIRTAYTDLTIDRTLVVYSDNHGEFMVTANGDFKTDLTACASNTLGGGKHCKPGDKVGTGSIYATADYNDFRGKHFPVKSNVAVATWTWGGYKDVTVEAGETDQYKYVVFHAMDRDGMCFGSTYSIELHPVLSSLDVLNTINGSGVVPTILNAGDPVESVNFLIDSGEGIILGTSGLPASNAAVAGGFAGPPTASINDGRQFATTVPTYSLALEAAAVSGKKVFPLSSLAAAGQTDECQAWIRVSNSLLGVLNVLVIAADDEGNIGFDKIIDLTNTTSYSLTFRWSLVTWVGADNITVSDALKGTGTSGKNPGGNDISASVTAIYGWDGAAQQWLGYFPTGVNVPGANDLATLDAGSAYWIAITGPGSVTWTIASNVD